MSNSRRELGTGRGRTTARKHLSAEVHDDVEGTEAAAEVVEQRPRTRGECRDGVRPCPWVGCRHHLYLEVTRTGGIAVHAPSIEPDEMEESCSLDVAERGTNRLITIGRVLNVTRERVRQLEVKALFAYKAAAQQHRMRVEDLIDGFAHAIGQVAEDAA